MVFSSAFFLLLFLPVVFILNFFCKKEYSNVLLLIASLIFYAWGEPYLVLLMIVLQFTVLSGRCSVLERPLSEIKRSPTTVFNSSQWQGLKPA